MLRFDQRSKLEILPGITIPIELMPEIHDLYNKQIHKITVGEKDKTLSRLKETLSILSHEEANLGRLFITGKINESAYDQLREEWKVKIINLQMKIDELEIDVSKYLDDLEVALALLSHVSELYERLDDLQKNNLLRILIKQIIINQGFDFFIIVLV